MDKKWWTLIAVCTGIFMLLLDVTIVIVAQPSIQAGLHAGFSDVQWTLDAYALTLASLLLTSGVLADRYGRKLLFTIGLAIFTLGSLLCGLAVSPLMLIVSRCGQGVGGAMMFATSLALLGQTLPRQGPRRGVRRVGGGRRPLHRARPGARRDHHDRLGLAGHLPRQRADRRVRARRDAVAGRGVQVAAPDAAGLVGLRAAHRRARQPGLRADQGRGGHLVRPRRDRLPGRRRRCCSPRSCVAESRVAHPMFDLSLLRVPTFSGGSIAAFAMNGSLYAMLLYFVIYLQDVLGYSALGAGLRIAVLSAAQLVTSVIAGRLAEKVPTRWLIGPGLLLVGIGLHRDGRADRACRTGRT